MVRKQPPVPDWTQEPAKDKPPRSAKEARRKREPRAATRNGNYHEGPAGDKECAAEKQDGGRCTLSAGWGTDHVGYGPCKYHMGATSMGRKTAAEEMAGELMLFYGEPIDTNPVEALLDEVSRTAGHVAWLAARIGKFNVPLELEQINPDTKIRTLVVAGIPPEVEGWLRMYMSERQQLVRVSKAALDAGVNERLVRIAEYQGEKLADAVETILKRLALSAQQQALVPTVVPEVLRQLVAGGPIQLIEGVTDDDAVRG